MNRTELFRGIGQVADEQVLEAHAVTPRRQVRRWPRYAALAACLVVLVGAAVWALRLPQLNKETPPMTAAGDAGGAEAGGAMAGGTGDGNEYSGGTGANRPAYFSSGVEIGYLDQVPKLGEAPESSEACLAFLTPEELFALDTAAFRGVVTGLQYLSVQTDSGLNYYTVAIVEVGEVFRGALSAGETTSILLPCLPGYATTSIVGALEDLAIGSEAIFLPYATDATTGWRSDESWFCYADAAQYYFSEGIRFLFLDTGAGLDFARDAYPAIAEAETLDEVGDYLRAMLD